MELLEGYGYVGLFFVLALFFAVVILLVPQILMRIGIVPRKPNPIKAAPYECGMDTVGKTWVQFNFRYYFLALLFVVFDIETVFLFPWAVAFRQLALFGFIEMLIFIAILVVGYLYAWKKQALEWK